MRQEVDAAAASDRKEGGGRGRLTTASVFLCRGRDEAEKEGSWGKGKINRFSSLPITHSPLLGLVSLGRRDNCGPSVGYLFSETKPCPNISCMIALSAAAPRSAQVRCVRGAGTAPGNLKICQQSVHARRLRGFLGNYLRRNHTRRAF